MNQMLVITIDDRIVGDFELFLYCAFLYFPIIQN